MTRSFTSSDPVVIAEFLRQKALAGTDTQAETVEAMRASLEQALVALSDLRVELAAARADRDRYVERMRRLERREEHHREVAAGKWDDEAWEESDGSSTEVSRR